MDLKFCETTVSVSAASQACTKTMAVFSAKKMARLILLTMIAESLLWSSRSLQSNVLLVTQPLEEEINLFDGAALPITGAFANCTDPRSYLNTSQPYDDQITISCHTFGYRAPISILQRQIIQIDDDDEIEENPLRLLVGVLSNNATMRQAIRETWGSSLRATNQLFFLVANQNFKSIEAEYEKESDLLWLDMENNYYKLTYMTSAMLTIFHRHATYTHILKTDDDCYVHVDRLLKHVEQLSPSVHYHGQIPQLEPIRNKDEVGEMYHKYILSQEDYPEPYFAPYASGPGYIVTPKMNECVVRELSRIRYMPFEDVYVGLLAERCGFECDGSNLFVADLESRLKFEKEVGLSDEILVQHRMTDTSERMKEYPKHPRKAFFQQSDHTGASATCKNTTTTNNNSKNSTAYKSIRKNSTWMMMDDPTGVVFRNDSARRTVVVSCRTLTYKAPLQELKRTRADKLLYLVLGSGNLEQRQAVRRTWASRTGSNHSVYFVVHAPRIRRFRDEYSAHRDLIWIQTTKKHERVSALQAAMQAIHKHARFRYLVVVNSQTYVYPDRLENAVRGDVFGPCSTHVIRIQDELRNDTLRGVAPELYPEPYFPPKCATRIGYAMSESLVACAAEESAKIRHHPMETIAMGMLTLRCGAWTVDVRDHFLVHPQQETNNTSQVVMVGSMLNDMMQGKEHVKTTTKESNNDDKKKKKKLSKRKVQTTTNVHN